MKALFVCGVFFFMTIFIVKMVRKLRDHARRRQIFRQQIEGCLLDRADTLTDMLYRIADF